MVAAVGRVLAGLVLLGVGGCRFVLQGLPLTAAPADAGGGGGGQPDLLAAGDLAPPAPDLLDPCAGAPPPPAGALAAACVIGAPPTLDGKLDDWPAARFLPITRAAADYNEGAWPDGAPADDATLSGRFALAWDARALYIAVRVTDDVRVVSPANINNRDSLELFLDGDHDRAATYGPDDHALTISADGNAMDFNVYPTGSVLRVADDGGSPAGWVLEAAIPWSQLGGAAATVGRVVGFDLRLNDDDTGAAVTVPDRALVWWLKGAQVGTSGWGALALAGR
jgi:hypothetical protein